MQEKPFTKNGLYRYRETALLASTFSTNSTTIAINISRGGKHIPVSRMDSINQPAGRGRGRPPLYVWTGDEELSESMEKLKLSIERRRKRQKEQYHRRKKQKQLEKEAHQRKMERILHGREADAVILSQEANGNYGFDFGAHILDLAIPNVDRRGHERIESSISHRNYQEQRRGVYQGKILKSSTLRDTQRRPDLSLPENPQGN